MTGFRPEASGTNSSEYRTLHARLRTLLSARSQLELAQLQLAQLHFGHTIFTTQFETAAEELEIDRPRSVLRRHFVR